MENMLSLEEAQQWIADNDVWGATRLYGVIADGEECGGQTVAIKSLQNLTRYPFAKLYTISTRFSDMVRKA